MELFTDDEPHGVSFLIDNKSYASCEAVARGLNPLKWTLNKLLSGIYLFSLKYVALVTEGYYWNFIKEIPN